MMAFALSGTVAFSQSADKGAGEPTRNLLTNGSFELGLGAEPFYPGWQVARDAYPNCEAPALPKLDAGVAHSGAQSLELSRARGRGIACLDIQSPDFSEKTITAFSFWTKASRPGVELYFGVCSKDGKGRLPNAPKLIQGSLVQEWQQWKCELPVSVGFVPLKIQFSSKQEEPFEVWVDDVNWTMKEPPAGSSPRAGAVEVVLLPSVRNGIHFAEQPVNLTWSADSDKPRHVKLKLLLRDLTRRTELKNVWTGNAKLGSTPRQGVIPIPAIKRGAYLAQIEARDKASGALLGVSRERLTVMTDLRKVPSPVSFDVGYHGGVEWSGDFSFNWRGYWTLDEFFANNFLTGYRVQRDIWNWEDIEPLPGKYRWDALDCRIDAAYRNGCTTMVSLPHKPLNLPRLTCQETLSGPEMDNGRWIYKTGKDISAENVRSAPMGGSSDPQKRNLLIAPDPKALQQLMVTAAERYQGKITAIEYLNEPNLYITPKGLIEHYFEPVYSAVKKVAPGLPLLMNQTGDFDADGNGYMGQFLKLGGANFCDGVTYHPYGADLLKNGGLNAAKAIESTLEQYSTPEKNLSRGMSEIHGLGATSDIALFNMTFVNSAPVQRALLDWSIGCRWSAGVVLSRNSFYEGVGPRNWSLRGPSAPGVGAAYMNGLYATLGGYRVLKGIPLDNKVLILCFERTEAKPGDAKYAVAITAAQAPLQTALLESALDTVHYTAFDSFGEPMKLAMPSEIKLGQDAIYLKSNDEKLFDVLKAGRVSWGQEIEGTVEDLTGPDAERVIYSTGLPPSKLGKCGIFDRWTLIHIGDQDAEGKSPLKLGMINESGELTWPVNNTMAVEYPLPYVVLSAREDKKAECAYAYSSIRSRTPQDVTFRWSATGAAVLWLNGKDKIDFSNQADELVGRKWKTFTWHLNKGMNHILVQTSLKGNPCNFTLRANPDSTENPVSVDKEGFIRKWKMVGPWKNPRNSEGTFLGNARPFPPERQPDAPDFSLYDTGLQKMPLVWHEETSDKASISHPWNAAVSYAFAAVEVEQATECLASLGSDDGYTLWINGALVGRNAASRQLTLDNEKLPTLLKKGRNTILFKVDDTASAGGFALRFLDKDGHPVSLRVVE